jgi:hypothetical protein
MDSPRHLEEEEFVEGTDSVVLKNTLRIYGTLFVVILFIFCFLRRRYPEVYNLRAWVEEIKTPLAENQHGTFSWMWRLFFVSDSEILDECGLDALCYTRVLEFGLKLSLFGVFNALWLIPVYKTAKGSDETDYITDSIQSLSIANVPSASNRLFGTVLAAYLIFGYTMYNILKEFEWFILQRRTFLSNAVSCIKR